MTSKRNISENTTAREALKSLLGIYDLETAISYASMYVGVTWDNDDPSCEMTKVGWETWQEFPFFKQDLEVVLLADDMTINGVLASAYNPLISGVTDGSEGQVMTKFKKLYYKETVDDSGRINGLYVSPSPLSGYTLHPKFSWGYGRDEIYLGTYEASLVDNMLASVSGQAMKTSINMETAYNYAQSRSSNFGLMDYWSNHLVTMLTLIEQATFDIQSVIPGYTNRSAWDSSYMRLTGRSNVLANVNGSVDYDPDGDDADLDDDNWSSTERKIANRILFIENFYGNIFKFMANCAADGRVDGDNAFYHSPDPRLFSVTESEILANWTKGGILPSDQDANYILSLQAGLLPKELGGNSSTYVPDYFWGYMDDTSWDYFRSVRSSGALSLGAGSGLLARHAAVGLSAAYSSYGFRLCAEENNENS